MRRSKAGQLCKETGDQIYIYLILKLYFLIMNFIIAVSEK